MPLAITLTDEDAETICSALRQKADSQEVFAKGAPQLTLAKRNELMVEAKGWRNLAMNIANGFGADALVEA